MSFGSQSSMQLKKFESQGEVDEKKRKRQEEWERVRKPDDPLEAPEEETRSLWQQLQDNQDVKQQEIEEQYKLRNSVKGLEDEEVKFLEHVSNRQVQLEKEREKEESVLFQQLREAAVKRVADKPQPGSETKKLAPSTSASSSGAAAASGKKSQQSLLLGAIKRKSTETVADEPAKRKRSQDGETNGESSTQAGASEEDRLLKLIDPSLPVAQVAGVLPGIGCYGNETSDSDSSSAESDIEDYLKTTKTVVYVQAHAKGQSHDH